METPIYGVTKPNSKGQLSPQRLFLFLGVLLLLERIQFDHWEWLSTRKRGSSKVHFTKTKSQQLANWMADLKISKPPCGKTLTSHSIHLLFNAFGCVQNWINFHLKWQVWTGKRISHGSLGGSHLSTPFPPPAPFGNRSSLPHPQPSWPTSSQRNKLHARGRSLAWWFHHQNLGI